MNVGELLDTLSLFINIGMDIAKFVTHFSQALLSIACNGDLDYVMTNLIMEPKLKNHGLNSQSEYFHFLTTC